MIFSSPQPIVISMMRAFSYFIPRNEEDPTPQRKCNQEGCTASGEYPAPRSRDNLQEHLWFCLQHIRKYNANWNYYAEMNVGEIESHWRGCTTWERPTWPIGSRTARPHIVEEVQQKFYQFFYEQQPNHSLFGTRSKKFPANSAEAKSLVTFKLSEEFTMEQLKKTYKSLAKKHHPDTNGGCKQAEEKLKEINQAYECLKAEIRNQKVRN